MKIKRVEIENIKNCRSAVYCFESGTNAICGPNGAGKTTIVEAISWVLFDHLPYKKANFVRLGEKKGTVRVFVDFGEMGEYLIERDTQNLYRVLDETRKLPVAEGKVDVIAWLKRVMGLDPLDDLDTLFSSSIGVPQGTFSNDFNLPPSRRKQVFDGLLKVEEYRAAAEQLVQSANFIRERIGEVQLKLARNEGAIEKLPELKEQRERWQNERSVALKGLQNLEANLKEAQIDVERFLRLQEEAALAEAEFGKKEQSKAFLGKLLENAIARQAESSEALAEVERLNPEVSLFQKAEEEGKVLEKRRSERESLEKEKRRTEEGKRKLEASGEGLEEKLKAIAEARIRIGEIAPLLSRQEALQKDISEKQRSLGQYEELKKQLAGLSREVEDLSKREAELCLRREMLAPLKVEAEKHPSLLEEREKKRHLLAEVKEREQKKKLLLAQGERVKKIEAEISSLSILLREKPRLEKEANDLPLLEEELDCIKAVLAESNSEMKRLETIPGQIEGGRCPILDLSCPSLSGQDFEATLLARRKEFREKIAHSSSRFNEVKKNLSEAQKSKNALLLLAEKSARLLSFEREKKDEKALFDELVNQIALLPGDEEKQLQAEWDLLSKEVEKASEAARLYSTLEALEEQIIASNRDLFNKKAEVRDKNETFHLLSTIPEQLAKKIEDLAQLHDPAGETKVLNKEIEKEGLILAEKEKNQGALLEALILLSAASEKLKPFEGLDERLGELGLLRERHKGAFLKQLGLLPLAANLVERSEEKARSERDFLEASEQLALAQNHLLECRRNYQRDPHLAAQRIFDDLKARQIKLDLQVKYFQGQVEEKEESIAVLEKIRASLKEVWEEKARWEDTLAFLEFARQSLKEAGPRITETYLMNVSHRANQLFRAILESEGDLVWGRDYEITLSENGTIRPFNNLSGGEQMAAALAVRLALIKEISNLDVAFFDEPTTNLDGERRKNLARQIGQIRDFSQLFVISHDDTFEESTDHVVRLTN